MSKKVRVADQFLPNDAVAISIDVPAAMLRTSCIVKIETYLLIFSRIKGIILTTGLHAAHISKNKENISNGASLV